MTSIAKDRWIPGISPTDRAVTVAGRTLRDRLDAVSHYLNSAAEEDDPDGEHVHQLRVWSRRAVAALDLYQEWLPPRRYEWMRKQLKRIRHAAGEARDCDVLIGRLKSKRCDSSKRRWLHALQAEREDAQRAIVEIHDQLRHKHHLVKRIDALLDHITADDRHEGATFGAWAHERLPVAVEAMFTAIPTDHTDPAALHQFRIRSKELRYVMELLAGAFPEPFRTTLYPAVETLQDRLGELNDLATAQRRLEQKIESADGAHEVTAWRRLLAREGKQLEQKRRAFWEWCTPAWLHDLRHALAVILDDSFTVADVHMPVSSMTGRDSSIVGDAGALYLYR